MASPGGGDGDAGRAVALSDFGLCVFSPKGAAHILFERDGNTLQLAVFGMHSPAEAVQLFAEIPVAPECLKAFLQAQEAFHSFLWNKGLPRDFDRLSQRPDRLELTLRALDGWISGASQKEIAISLFGARVEGDWGRGHDYLKSQVRRFIKRGRWLMEGGYRRLLR